MGDFQIGIYQPLLLPPTFPGPTPLLLNNYNQTYIGTGVALNYYTVYGPQTVMATPPAAIGQDTTGAPSIRGYEQMQWVYPMIRSDNWYYLYNLWRLAQQASGAYMGHVRIQWPDPVSGTDQTVSARWDVMPAIPRNQPTFHDVTLTFTHLGIDDMPAPSGIYAVG